MFLPESLLTGTASVRLAVQHWTHGLISPPFTLIYWQHLYLLSSNLLELYQEAALAAVRGHF